MQQKNRTYKTRIGIWLHTCRPLKILWLTLLAVLAVYLVILLLAPGRQVRRLDSIYTGGKDAESPPELFSDYPGVFALQQKKAFLESRLKMARTDSIGLAVSLPDSLVTLEINGIILHRARISSYRVSRLFSAVSPRTCLGMFSEPLVISSYQATIEKVPLINRKAPKDSIEAAEQLAEVPDTVLKKPPLVALSSGYDIQLQLYPDEGSPSGGKMMKFMFNTLQALRMQGQYLSSVIRLQIPYYRPVIRIYMTDREIISLFRALPEHARVSVML
jgi:hypothetical protein